MIQQQVTASDLLNEGNQFFAKGSYEDAIQKYVQIMQMNESKYKQFAKRGLEFAELGKNQLAINSFLEIHNFTPIDIAQYLRGMASHYEKNYKDALSDFTSIIQRCPLFKFGYNDRGNVYSCLKQSEQAISDYTEAIKLDREYLIAYDNRGLELNKLRRSDEAIKDHSQAIEIDPEDAISYLHRGYALSDQGRNEDAINDYSKAIQIDPQHANAYYQRGILQQKLGRQKEAISDFSKAIEINPQNPDYYFDRGLSLFRSERYEEAVSDYSKVTKMKPKDEIAYYSRGNGLFKIERYDDALIDYSRAIEINPQYDTAHYMRGVALYKLGRLEDAISSCQKAIEINPKQADVYVTLGSILNSLGRHQDAINDSLKALQIDQKNADAHIIAGNAFSRLGRLQEALKEYQKASSIDPQHSIAHYNIGFILSKLGRKEDAIIEYSKAIQINPQYASAYLNRGNAFQKLGRKQDSFNDLQKALQIEPQNPLINVNLGRYYLNNDKEKANEYFIKALNFSQTLTHQDRLKYNLSENNLNYIKQQVKLIQQIDEDISRVKILIKSKTLTEDQQNLLQENIQPIEDEFNKQIEQPIDNDTNNSNNDILQQLLKRLNDLELDNKKIKQEVLELKSQKSQIIKKEMNELKQDKNRYIYYQSLYWRLYNYISACQQLSTDLFSKNTDTVIDNNYERVAQITSKVAQQISNSAGSIPIVGTVVKIISSAREFALANYLDYKFDQIFKKLTQIVQVRCDNKNDIDEEIQLAIIKSANKLPQIYQEQQIEDEGLMKYVQQIWKTERDNGILQAENPYWKQGAADTLKILQNLLVNYGKIQCDQSKELHIIILDQLQASNLQIVKAGVRQSCCERFTNKCQIF